jgi:hypothetical protein
MKRPSLFAVGLVFATLTPLAARASDLGDAEPAPTVVAPQERLSRWAIDASTGAAYITSRSFDLIGGADAMPVGDFRVSFTPGWLHRHLELNLAYVITGEGGSTFQDWQTSFQMQTVQLGALYRWRFGDRLSLYARAAGLVDFDHLSLSMGSGTLPVSQDAVTGGVVGAGGLELIALRDRNFDLGFTLEVGYGQRFESASFENLTAQVGDPKPQPIAVTGINAGTLDVSGIEWRLGVAVHF